MRPAISAERLHYFVLWCLIGIGLCALFVYACLMPSPPSEPGIPYFDKVEHAGAFIVMGAWFAALFVRRPVRVGLSLAVFAAITELLQSATGYRDGDILDWCADCAGLAIGMAAAHLGGMNWLYGLDRFVASKAH
tara:strand:- start:805 stop:1209 length:405 start_codon:yes stop_codon:yes gene_type:complete